MKWVVKLKIVLCIMFVSLCAHARVWVDGNYRGTPNEFIGHCQALRECQSFANWWVTQDDQSQNEVLQKEFKDAINHYLSGQKQEAYDGFKQIVSKAQDKHWSEVSRHIIVQSFFRLASLEFNKKQKTSWLWQALRFDPLLQISSDEVSPELQEELLTVQTNQPHYSVSWPEGYPYIQINSRLVDTRKTSRMKLPVEAKFLVTFVSNRYRPVTTTLTPKEIQKFTPEKVSLANTCTDKSHPQLAELGLKDYKIFRSNSCQTDRKNTDILAFHPKMSEQISNDKSLNQKMIQSTGQTKSKATFLEKNKSWIYWGAGIAIGAVIYQQQQKDSDTKPAHRKSF